MAKDFEVWLAGLIVIALGVHYTGAAPKVLADWLILAAALFGTAPVLVSAARQLWRREISMDLLASVALIFSLLSQEWTSAAFIALMLVAARFLQKITERQAERSIKSLLKLRPNLANRINRGQLETVSINQLSAGDTIIVDLGERIPVDGVISSGAITVDESSLTGESLPVEKNIGAKVFSSTILVSGSAQIIVEKIGRDTTLEKIIALVESAGQHKPRYQTIGERFGKIYLIGIFLVSGLVFYLTQNTSLVLSIVLVVCADDVAVAVPLAYLAATRAAARRGVIIKGSNYLEALGDVTTIVFDKTGTLTTGQLQLVEIVPLAPWTKHNILAYGGALAEQSKHPIAKAVVAYAQAEKIQLALAERVEELGGLGLVGASGGQEIIFARGALMTARNIRGFELLQSEIDRLENEGKSLTYLAINNKLAGLLAFTDQIRPETKKTIDQLHQLGIRRTVMLTGDNQRVAKTVANASGIKEVHSQLLPGQKVEHLKHYLTTDRTVAMVGDGINDAAALRGATVGIVLGAIGYDVAIESADIVLMRDQISKIPELIKLARFVKRIALQDFVLWGISNILGLSLVFSGVIGPAGAAAYNFITDFFPLFNSLRAGRKQHGKNS
ncbi:MAG: cation-translocating P-type ATPase [Patescibacteria group bacterium]